MKVFNFIVFNTELERNIFLDKLEDLVKIEMEAQLNMKEWSLKMSDGVIVHAYSRLPKGTPIGHIHFLHGMEEQSGRYDTAADYFIEQGYIVSAHDHRGHGKTAEMNGTRGHFADKNGFSKVVNDTFEVVSFMRSTY